MTAKHWITVAALTAGTFYVAIPKSHNGTNSAARTEAISNGRQLHINLVEFSKKYDTFPSTETLRSMAAEKKSTEFPLITSNDYFRQFIVSGISKSDRIGWCHHPKVTGRKADDIVFPLDQAFAPGECGFSYVTGLSANSPPDMPVLLAPMIPGTTRFDPEPFKGKAIVVRVDGTVTSEAIKEDGRVNIGMGKTLFDHDALHWHGTTPYVVHPGERRKD
jgi:hypothetical protein